MLLFRLYGLAELFGLLLNLFYLSFIQSREPILLHYAIPVLADNVYQDVKLIRGILEFCWTSSS